MGVGKFSSLIRRKVTKKSGNSSTLQQEKYEKKVCKTYAGEDTAQKRWVLLISFGRFLSYFGSHFVSGRRSVAGYTTDETYKMEAKEPERWQKVNIPSMSTQTVGINRTHLKDCPTCLLPHFVLPDEDYAVRFAVEPRPVWAVGLNVSEDRRTIESYEMVACKQ